MNHNLRDQYEYMQVAMRKRNVTLYVIALCLFLLQTQGFGHSIDQVYMELSPKEKSFSSTISIDASYCLPEFRADTDEKGPGRSWLLELPKSEHERLRKEATSYIKQSLKMMLDEQPIPYTVTFPDYDTTPPNFAKSIVDTPILRINLTGIYPITGGSLQVSWSEEKEAYLLLNVEWNDGGEVQNNLLQIADGQMMDIGVEVSASSSESTIKQQKEMVSIKRQGWFSFVKTGFDHIVPLGLDHIAFVVGLFLCSPMWRPLLRQTLVFTLAHSITLALSLIGVLTLNIQWVEVIIALSIVYIAIENLCGAQVGFRRLLLVFMFGLLHGLGFGAVLGEYLPSERVFWPLVGFNVGVELGQMLVLLTCFLTLGWFRKSFRLIRITGSLLLVGLGLFWIVERLPS